MSNDHILSAIREYVDECMREPKWRMSKEWFRQVSYSRWAVGEIMKSIEESRFTPPIMVVEDFIRKMDDFSCRNKKTSIIFSVAHDMAENILDVLIAMK